MTNKAKIKQLKQIIEEQRRTINMLRAVIIKAAKMCEEIRKVIER